MTITGKMASSREADCEKLFLLEVLVDKLFISHSSLNMNRSLVENLTDICVLFQFLHYPPLAVCESDFIGYPTGRTDSNHITFQSGKSCFFSLRVPKGPVLPTPFDINVSVVYRMKEDMLPDKLEIGKTSIEMSDSFTQLLSTNMDENCDKLPLSKSKTGTFELKDEAGNTVGNVTAFVRLSCFGKLIITQFSLNKENDKSYFFKGTDAKQFCGDKESRFGKKEGELISGTKDTPKDRTERIGHTQDTLRIGPKDGALYCGPTGRGPKDGALYCRSTDRGLKDGALCCWTTNIVPKDGALCCGNKNGYDMSNEVQPRMAPALRPYTTRPISPPAEQYQKYLPPAPRFNLCDCPYSMPQNIMTKKTPKTDSDMGLAPGEVGLQDDQIIFQLPLKRPGDPMTSREKETDSQIYYRLTSAEETSEGHQKNTVHIKSDDLPGMAGKRIVGPVSGLPVDDGHDVFLLKIGKKCDGDKKRNLELELRTPKMKEPKPPMTDQNTQYLESDIPVDSTVKSGGKGKSNKGKGKEKSKGKGKKGKK